MQNFKSILVGIDLSQTLRTGSTAFLPPVEQAIKEAVWIAKHSQAPLTFFSAIDVPSGDVYLSGEDLQRFAGKLHESAAKALGELVARAKSHGVSATSKIAAGAGWKELIREVLRHGHDLVVVGARNRGSVERFLFGSTTMKLLHNCPCPVWVTQPEPREVPQSILATSDFSPVSDEVIRAAGNIALAAGAKLHLLHAVDCPLDRLWGPAMTDFNTQVYHQKMILAAKEKLGEQAERVLGTPAGLHVQLHVTERVVIADLAIADFIKNHQVDLLAIGTMARGGVPGVFIGNTAERLLTTIQCSLLAVKPADFQCPIELPPGEQAARPVL
jgi:universal stress protein E